MNLRLNRYLTGRGYRWVRRTGINDWYVPRDSDMRVDLEGRLQFFRKHYLESRFRHVRERCGASAATVRSPRVTAVGRYSEPDKTRSTQVRSRGCQAGNATP